MYSQYVLLAEAFYVLTTTVLKISLGLFFLRVTIGTWQRYTFYTLLSLSTIFGAFFFFVAIFQCGLPADFLENKTNHRICLDNRPFLAFGYTYATICFIADWTFVILPIFMLRGMKMNLHSKIS